MRITKLLNNNVVIAKDRKKGEVVVMGTGIGFRASVGDLVRNELIQKVFMVHETSKLASLISQIPASYLELTERIVSYAQKHYHMHISENIYLSLTDHIYFALKRIQDGMDIDNPFLIDVKQFYKDEYAIALHAKVLIKELYELIIPDEEVGYIALHIIENTSNLGKRAVGNALEVIEQTLTFIKAHYLQDCREDSLAYTRLINHVKHFAKRYVDHEENESKDQLLSKTILEVFQEECLVVDELSEALYKTYGREILESEKNYLILHLRNCKELK